MFQNPLSPKFKTLNLVGLKEITIKGIVIAATKSGSGKTTVCLGLLAALTQKGIKVAPFKVGPDFIDPGHHFRVTGATSRNLDGWMLPDSYNKACFARYAKGADMVVVEGVMGLFDGYDGKSEAGSTAQMAKQLGLPVILVVDAKSMARSAAALVMGFEQFDPDLDFAGVIFNNLGSERHFAYLKEAMENTVSMPVLGGIIRNSDITIPERHLGLVTDQDHRLSQTHIQNLAALIEENLDLDQLINQLPDLSPPDILPLKQAENQKVRIGIAKDNAFCFYYKDNLDLLEQCGATLVFFSPVNDKELPENLHGIYFGGGYPEIHAEKLAQNQNLKDRVFQLGKNGMPIYGECGGFMYLCKTLTDHDGNTFPMTGIFPFDTQMLPKLRSLGYREITLDKDTSLGPCGQVIRGHEFHYSKISKTGKTFETEAIETVYSVSDRLGMTKAREGYCTGQTIGSYFHLHFGSCPDAPLQFINACRNYKNRTKKQKP